MTLVELTVFLAVAMVVAALFASIFLVIWRRGAAPTPDHVPIRLGVILLGAIGLTCIGGLFYLSNTPDLSQGSDQSSGTAQTPGETALLQAQGQQGVTESVVNSTNQVVKNASTDAATLGVSNQIVGLLGTIAGASVAGIAGLLVGPGKTEQPPSSDGEGAGDGGTSPPTSPADRLRVWAKLRDEGIITDRDFNRMKEQILLEEEQKTSSVSARAQQLGAANGEDTTPPKVRLTNPQDKADDVPPDIHPSATFSKEMDSSTINPNTFKLRERTTLKQVPPPGPDSVHYDELNK